MKVLNVNKFYYIKGGSETYFFALSDLLEKHGHKVIPFSMQDDKNINSKYSKYFIENIDYETKSFVKKIKYALKVIYSREAKRKIAIILKNEKPDLVHLHNFQHQFSPSILPEIKKRNIPIVHTAHDYKVLCPVYTMFNNGKNCDKCKGGKYLNCFINKCSKNSRSASFINTVEMYFHRFRKYYDLIDIFITPSEFQKNKMIEHGFSHKRIKTVPSFINENLNSRSVKYSKYFLFFGRLSHEKGLDVLIEAMKGVSSIKLFIVGNGPLRTRLEKKANKINKNNIKFLNHLENNKLKNLIAEARFTVCPSEWNEVFGLSAIEALTFCKPVIASRVGGLTELIEDGKNGFLVEPGNVNDLNSKINLLSHDLNLVKKMGQYAKDSLSEKYIPEYHYKKIFSIYENLLNK